jgi:ATP-dependent DNA helicase UvrD/PcrA
VDHILDGLDNEQIAAVTAPVELLAVVAGPGAGKTRVLTRRIAYRCRSGSADASHVLAATFSRRAARELKERLHQLGIGRDLVVGTFHGLALSQLRMHARDNDRALPTLVHGRERILSSLAPELDTSALRSVSAEIDWALARCIPTQSYAEQAEVAQRRPGVALGQVAEIAQNYLQAKRNRRIYDFNDLLEQWTSLLQQDAVFSAAQRWRFRHLFIDEMQDLTKRQIKLVAALLDGGQDGFFVGDPDQSIYGFAGAGSEADLHAEFPGIQQLELKRNHRSTPEIVAASSPLATRSHQSSRDNGPDVARYEASAGGAPLVRAATEARDSASSWSQIAVLARSNAQVTRAAEILNAAGIPHSVRRKAQLLDSEGMDLALRRLGKLQTIEQVFGALPELGLEATRLKELTRLVEDYRLADSGGSPSGLRTWLRLDNSINVEQEGIQLATFHASKGLEWPAVILHDVRSAGTEAEERRLLFVAMTRASESLTILSHRAALDWLPDIAYSTVTGSATAQPPWRQELQRGRIALTSPSDPVLEAVMAWRGGVAQRARITPTAVLTSERARRIAEQHPVTIEDLAELAGWGPAVSRELAVGLLAALDQSDSSSTTGV